VRHPWPLSLVRCLGCGEDAGIVSENNAAAERRKAAGAGPRRARDDCLT
jgi:hypothetical protein